MAKITKGTEVRYCHEGSDRKARVTEVSETGDVLGIAVHDDAGNIEFGVSTPLLASTPQHRITNGYFWAQ